MRTGVISKKDLDMWRQEAKIKRLAVSTEEMTLEEFAVWCDETFVAIKRKTRCTLAKFTRQKASKIAIAELGTSKGLVENDSNDEFIQRYEMQLGKHTVVVQNCTVNEGYAFIKFFGKCVFYNINTLEENTSLSEQWQSTANFETQNKRMNRRNRNGKLQNSNSRFTKRRHRKKHYCNKPSTCTGGRGKESSNG
jgi:hypothetical protein